MKFNPRSTIIVTTFATAVALAGYAFGHPGHGKGPPPEALAACEDLDEGDACEVTIRGRALPGTCHTGPADTDELACMPARMGPPPEAFTACADAQSGDACTISFEDRELEGVCRVPPHTDDGELLCVPNRPAPPRD